MNKYIPSSWADNSRLIGSECVYYERGKLLHIKITSIKIHRDILTFVAEQLNTIGFSGLNNRVLEFSCTQDYLKLHSNYLHSSIVSWTLVVNSQAVDYIVCLAAISNNFYSLCNDFKKLRRSDFSIEAIENR